MRRRHRAPLLVLALCLVLGAGVYLQLRHEQAAAYEPLTDTDLAAVRELVVECR